MSEILLPFYFLWKSTSMEWLFLPLVVLCTNVSGTMLLWNCSSCNKCICTELKDRTLTANCSNLNLSSFPTFHKDVTVIYISDNNIQGGALPKNLRELILSRNKLWYDESLKLSFVENLTQLEILDISDNVDFKRTCNMTYPATDFRLLQKLKALYIDGLCGGDFNAEEWNLTSLTNLTVSGKTGKCFFQKLHQGFFSGLPCLEFLRISGCRSLRSIDTGVFDYLHVLHTLDLSFNEYLTFAPLENVSLDLQKTNCQVLIAKKLYCSFGIGTLLSRRVILNFRNTSIRELDLSSNRLELMDDDVPKYFPLNLEILNVSVNQISWGRYVILYPFLKNLETVDCSGQYSYKYHNVDALTCENEVECIEWSSIPFDTYSDDKQIHLNNSYVFDRRNITFNVPPKLKKLYFHSSQFRFSIGKVHIGRNHIKEYHVQNNFLNALVGPIYGLEYAQFVDFYGNFIRNISLGFFDWTPNITHLNFSNNLLGNCLSDVVQQDHFHALTKLIEIRLSNNGISTLPMKLLSNAISLQRLDLSHNLIDNYIFTLNDRCALQYLDLSSNRLRTISHETIRRLENIHKRNNLSVDLSGNFFDCTCETTFFLNWIHDSNINFVNKHSYQCRMSHKRKRTFTDLADILTELDDECSSDLPRTIGVTVSIMTVFIVGICCIFYRYRWTIRYFFYLTKWEIHNIVNPTKQKRQRNYEYSAFIIYAEKDSTFAETVMVQQLEGQNDMKMCLPNRDFSPNLRTYAHITHAIHNSRKIICLITKAFVEDYWCMYQLQMAEEERIHREDEDCIVFILFDSLSIENLEGVQRSLFLVSIIKQRSYALFPENKAEYHAFWQKLFNTVQ